MLSLRRPSVPLACVVSGVLLLCVAAAWPALGSAPARAASVGRLQQRINQGQTQISTLSGLVSAASGRLGQLDADIGRLQAQVGAIQTGLDAKRAELLKLRSELDKAQTRLAHFEAFEARGEHVLSAQLVGSYEADNPDLITVVLESTGFSDLLNQLSFEQRIQTQDVQVVSQVRSARRAVASQATKLGALELRQQQLTDAVLAQRNTLARARLSLVQQQVAVAQARNEKAGQLANARATVSHLQAQVNQIQAQQAALAQQSSGSSASGSSGSGSSSSGNAGPLASSGGFAFPLPKSAASPPSTWSPDQGVDISAPGDTPEYAVCSGTIVLHGMGGFGPWAPVLHCDSPIDGFDYVYYGHAGPENQLPVGTHVGEGQVMSSIGPGIVGISTGPHLELGFADSSGSPIGSQTASTMLSLLQAAYNG